MSLALPAAAEFPTLVSAPDVVYLDSAATSQTPLVVLDAMDAYYRETRASVHRGVYPLAAEATERFEGGRARIAALTGSTVGETVLTRNATEAINLVAYSWGGANVGPGDLVVLTEMEHHSNIVPWQLLAERTGAELAFVPVDTETFRLNLGALDALLARGPKLVGVVHVSNVLGSVNPVEDIVARAGAAGAVTVVDGTQAVPHMPVDVGAIGADFYVWTGHKAYGPTGIGVLHGRRALLEAMPPFLGGGHMISRVTLEGSRWAEPPMRFEAGTSAIAEGIGLGAACGFLSGIDPAAVAEHDADLIRYTDERLAEIEGVRVFGAPERAGITSFALDGVHPHDVAEILGRRGVCVRAGHHCAQPLMKKLGVPATSRASFSVHSTREDVDRLVEGLGAVREVFA